MNNTYLSFVLLARFAPDLAARDYYCVVILHYFQDSVTRATPATSL